MNHASTLKPAAVFAMLLSLTGCGSGGGSPATAPVNSSVQHITPSLGQFDENAHVVIGGYSVTSAG